VPAQVEVEGNSGQGPDLENRPAEEILQLPVIDGEGEWRLPEPEAFRTQDLHRPLPKMLNLDETFCPKAIQKVLNCCFIRW